MKSSLYDCVIKHQRLVPKGYAFSHGSFMFLLDLDQVAALPVITYNQPGFYSLYDEDHLPGYEGSIGQRLKTYLNGVPEDIRRFDVSDIFKITLLTNLRFFGYVFNPVSFFYCLDEQGAPLCAVAEVGNTFLEKKMYFLPPNNEPGSRGKFSARLAKDFYVSPFSELHLDFDFNVITPAEILNVNINEFDGTKPTLVSSVVGVQKELNMKNILALTCKYPLVTLRVITLIHFHALMLMLKKVPFLPKHQNAHLQTDVLNPHASLNKSDALIVSNVSNSAEVRNG